MDGTGLDGPLNASLLLAISSADNSPGDPKKFRPPPHSYTVLLSSLETAVVEFG